MADILALTVQQPWAWAIAEGLKPIENRSWRTNYRGLIAIHAGLGIDHYAVMPTGAAERALKVLRAKATLADAIPAGTPHIRRGGIVAVAELTGIHGADWCSPWAVRDGWHWELASVRRLPDPVPCKGRLGLWKLPEDTERTVMTQMEALNG